MSKYLGDFVEDSSHYFVWDSNGGDGASITRSTDGTVTVWKEGDSTAASVAGVTDDEDEGANVGVHRCSLVLTNAFYEKGKDYTVVLLASTIDGEVVNAVLAEFSIENRFEEVTLADGAQGGASMVLTFERMIGSSTHADGTIDIDNTAGAAMNLQSSQVAGKAVHIQATGSGQSIALYAKSDGTTTSAPGVMFDGAIGAMFTGTSAGLYAIGSGGAGGLYQGSTGYPGIVCMSGTQLVPNVPHALVMMPGTNGHGTHSPGNGTGHGINAVGGDTGHGINALGGATSGDGIHGEAQTDGDGMTLVGAGANQYDLNADIHGTIDTVTTLTTKTGFAVSQTGLDLVLKTTTFALAMADAIWDEAIAGHTTGTTFGGKNQKVVPSETIGDYKATGFTLAATWTDAKAAFLDASIAAIPTTAMRGTDNASLATTALTNVTWTDAKAAFLDASIAAIPTTAMRGTDNATLAATWTDAKAGYLTGDSYVRLGAPAGASVSADVAAVKTDTGNIASRITAALFSGITSLASWLGSLAGKAADAGTLAEIQATTAGAGYTNITDSQEAIRDNQGALVLTATERNAIADAYLARDVSNADPVANEHTARLAILLMTESNTVDNSGKLTIYQTDGTTEVCQKTITDDASADPVTGIA